jgi:hypothetical protein
VQSHRISPTSRSRNRHQTVDLNEWKIADSLIELDQ